MWDLVPGKAERSLSISEECLQLPGLGLWAAALRPGTVFINHTHGQICTTDISGKSTGICGEDPAEATKLFWIMPPKRLQFHEVLLCRKQPLGKLKHCCLLSSVCWRCFIHFFSFFFFFLLLSSFKTNDKKEFSNKVCVSLGTAFLCQLEAIPHVNSRALRPSQSDLLLGFSLKNLLVKPSLPNHYFQKEVKLKT